MSYRFGLILLLCCIFRIAYAQTGQVLTGTLNQDNPSVEFATRLQAGAVLVAVTRSEIDTVLSLQDSDGNRLAANNNANRDTRTSALAVRIPRDDLYTVVVTGLNLTEQPASFELRLSVGDDSLLPPIEQLTRIALSGPEQIHDTPHFRVHYTETGTDAAPAVLVDEIATALEQTWKVAIEDMGWSPPPPDVLGGDERYDVYLAQLPGPFGFNQGAVRAETFIGDNPHSAAVETFAAQSFMVIAHDFNDNRDDWIDLLRSTIAHEFTHALQMGYDGSDWHGWYYEATASWMETAVYPPHQSNLDNAAISLQYPELCLGTRIERDEIGLDYASWLLMQALVDAYDAAIIRQLWESIAIHEGFDGLIQMLATHNRTLPDVMLHYHAQRLTRDITFMNQIDTTVKISQQIEASGEFESAGDGVQELGANFITFAPPSGRYTISLDNDPLELWAVGIDNERADVFALNQSDIIDTSNYEGMFFIVFNPRPAEDPHNCHFTTYTLDITDATDEPASVAFSLNAANFIAPD